MAQAGSIKEISGSVSARTSQGEVRELNVGDLVYENELIVTSAGSSVTIELDNGKTIDLSENAQILIDESVIGVVDVRDAVVSEVESLQAALEAGEDITDAEEATAVGEEDDGFDYDLPYYAGDQTRGEVGSYLFGTEYGSAEEVIPEENGEIEEVPVVPPTISISDAEPVYEPEGDGPSVYATFTVTLSEASTETVTVDFTTADGTAIAGGGPGADEYDYGQTSGTVTFAPGETSHTITVQILPDYIAEPTENFYVNLSNPTNATIVDDQGIGTILGEEPPTLTIDDQTVDEAAGTMTFTVTMSNPSSQDVTFDYGSADETALDGSDYTALSGSGTIVAGTTSTTITVDITDDNIAELTETFQMNLSNASNATIADPQGIGTILDNDLPSLIIDDQTVNEDAGTMTFTVTMSNLSTQDVTFDYGSADGTAIAGQDYTALSGTGTIAAGSTSTTITVSITDDNILEPTENFVMNLTNAVNATIADPQGIGTILDNYVPPPPPPPELPTISISDAEPVHEPSDQYFALASNGDNGYLVDGTFAEFTVTLSAASTETVTVDFTTADGTAIAGGPGAGEYDYGQTSGTVTFLPGETSHTITVQILPDYIAEPTENFYVNLSNPTNATIADDQGIGTILGGTPPTVTGDSAAFFETDGVQLLTDSGTIDFGDIDDTDVVDVSDAYNSDIAWSGGDINTTLATTLVAGFNMVDVVDGAAPGSTTWTYDASANLDFLAAGETITFSYTVTATDSQNATATDVVTITITGTNDAPTIGDVADIGFTEAADASAQNLSDSGTVSFGDIDTNDVVDISTALTTGAVWSGGAIDGDLKDLLEGGFSASVTDADAPGTTPWSYSVTGADLDFLKAGETVTLTYTLTATDSANATATDTVTITITGTNDAPTIGDVADIGFTEAADASAQNLSDSGTVSFGDIDTNDVVDISTALTTGAVWSGGAIDGDLKDLLEGGFSASVTDADAPGTTPWSYSVTGADLDFLKAGETVTLTYTLTATDSANATATDTVTITITGTNDAPTLEAIVGGEVYESGLSTGTEPSTTTILASGILDYGDVDLADAGNLIVVDGTDIGLLTGNASHIYPGYTDGSHYGTIVFRGDGSWTYTLDTNIDNDSAAGASDLQGPDSFEVKIFDGTDYSAPQDLIINVLDDSPTAIVPEVGFLINKGGEAANDVRLDIDTNIDDNYGADQGGTVSFAAADGTEAFNTAGEVLTSGGATIYLYVSTDGQTLIGSTLSGSAYAAANVDTNTKVFTVELNTDGDLSTSTDNYSFTLHHQIDGGASSFSVEEGSYAPSGGNSAYYFFDDTSDADNDVLLSPTEPGSTINTSNNDFATGTGMTIGAGEGIRIDYVNGLSGDPKGAISYTDHYTVSGAGALIGMKGTSCSLRMVAYDDYGDGTDADPDDISIGNGVVDPITAVVVAHGNEMMTVYSGTISKVVDGITFTFDWTTSPDEVIIGNVDGATSLSAITADGFSSLEIHYVDGSPFTVNSFSGVAITPGAAVDFATDLNLTDADNDTVLIDDGITIQLSPEDHTLTSGTEDTDIMTVTDDVIGGTLLGLGGEDTLTGGASDDILAGGDGNDTIYGGAGNDTIYGGAGEDEIDAGEGNDYIDGGAGADIINAGEGDDSIVFDAADSHVDGEGEYDTLLVADDGILDFSNVTVHNVEKIDLNDDTTGQTVELTMQQVFDMTGDGNLTIGGVPTLELSGSGDDTVKINTTNWHQQGQTGLFTTNADGTGDAVMIDIADDATTGFSVVDQNNVDIDI